MDSAPGVTKDDICKSRREQQLRDRDRSSARAGDNDAHVLLPLAHDLERVCEPREGDDSGSVLIVVEDRDVAELLELALDLEAAGRRDILQIHAAEAAREEIHRAHEFVHVLRFDAERERVHTAEGLEEHAFALHDGHAGLGADVAETEHRRTVRDDGAEIVPPRERIALIDILLDLQARRRNAGGVGQREVVL